MHRQAIISLLVIFLGGVSPSLRGESYTTNIIDGVFTNAFGPFTLGDIGPYNYLVITNAGVLTNTGATIGKSLESSNNVAVVDGIGSEWRNGSNVYVGYVGSGNLLSISNGGGVKVRPNYSSFVGYNLSSSSNRVTVAGLNSELSCDEFYLGYSGARNHLLIEGGGQLEVGSGGSYLGRNASSHYNIAMVSGINSTWRSAGPLHIGYLGSHNQVIVTAGGMLTNLSCRVGDLSVNSSNNLLLVTAGGRAMNINGYVGREFSGNNTAVVTDPGSIWESSARFWIGQYGSNNSLTISNGGRVNSTNAVLGVASRNNAALVTGLGTLWSNKGGLAVGEKGIGNQMTISNGGRVECSAGYIGSDNAYASNNTVFVTGTNSLWLITSNLYLGRSNGHYLAFRVSSLGLVIRDGGQVRDYGGYLPGVLTSRCFALVSDPGSLWHNDGPLYIGAFENSLTITNGGRVNCSVCYAGIGGEGGGQPIYQGTTITVTRAGSVLTCSSNLVVGHGLGTGNKININAGGMIVTPSLLVGSYYAASNIVAVSGGTLNVTNSTSSAVLKFLSGSLFLNDGNICADSLVVTNGIGSSIVFHGGVLSLRSSKVDNGQLLFVGNGNSAATLLLRSNTHSFASGLVINSNALLQGIGSIDGNVTNAGTIAAGILLGILNINGSLGQKASASLMFQIGGTGQGIDYDFINVSNGVGFAGALRIALINGFQPGPADAFTLMQFGSASGAFANVSSGTRLKTVDNLGSFLVDYSGTALRLTDYQTTDFDGDAIEDAWAVEYFGHSPLTVAEKQADADGDGANNYDEFVAGTDPTDASSVFKLTAIPLTESVAIRFSCVAGKTYRVWHSTDLVSWSEVAAPGFSFPEPGICQWLDDGSQTGSAPFLASGQQRFYRVAVE